MRNLGTQVRIILVTILCGLFVPLISDSSVSYVDQIYRTARWGAPTLLMIMVEGYICAHFFLQLQEKNALAGIVAAHVTNLSIFFFVDYVLIGEETDFWLHFRQMNAISLGLMWFEGYRQQTLTPALTEARLTALTARIRPHFLFNSLNAAISLIRLRPYDAETLLENLANLFRAQLRDGSQSSTLGQEIEWAQEYMAIEQIRMGPTRVQVMWHHHAPDDAETPHLLLQPLLENAVFHGIESSHRPGCIVVETTQKHNWLYIMIENPYIPPESDANVKPHKGNSMALRNLRERLALMYDNDAVAKTEQTDTVFRVRIRLPYRRKGSALDDLFGR